MHHAIRGLHHVTTFAGPPRPHLAFHGATLGTRLVKRTVNFDDPSAWHFYFGDEQGSPGSVFTSFCWAGHSRPARQGAGMASRIAYAVPRGSLAAWRARLEAAGTPTVESRRLGAPALRFDDPDGIPFELLEVEDDPRAPWTGGGAGDAIASRGMATVELRVHDAAGTADVLSGLLGFEEIAAEGNLRRFAAGDGRPGDWVDVLEDRGAPAGTMGRGAIHHLAFRITDKASQAALRGELVEAGLRPSEVRDRQYFRSIYFLEPGGVLFEVATVEPGFAIDEPLATLGTRLCLPPQYEPHRAKIEAMLPSA